MMVHRYLLHIFICLEFSIIKSFKRSHYSRQLVVPYYVFQIVSRAPSCLVKTPFPRLPRGQVWPCDEVLTNKMQEKVTYDTCQSQVLLFKKTPCTLVPLIFAISHTYAGKVRRSQGILTLLLSPPLHCIKIRVKDTLFPWISGPIFRTTSSGTPSEVTH